MQPSSGSPQYQPQSGYAGAPQDRPVRVRPWLVGTAAAVVMLVLIAALSNQGVSDRVTRRSLNPEKFYDDFLYSTTTVYGWRFSPRLSRDIGHVWLAGLIFDVLVIVLTLLITAALAKNKRGFGGSFLAAWVAVFAATQVSAYVRASIVDIGQLQGRDLSKPVSIFFGTYSPGQFSLFAGVLYGLVAALIAGLVGAVARRTDGPAGSGVAGYPPVQHPEALPATEQ